jgi:PPOX class probable F420-dependent enzyme
MSGKSAPATDGALTMRKNLRPGDVADLLELPIVAVLATRRPDDSVMLSPVWFEWRDGGFSVWVPSTEDNKIRHIRRDPRVSIVVANSDWPYKGLEVRGQAKVLEDADTFYDLLRRTGDRYEGAGEGDAMVKRYKPGVVVRIEPGAIRAWDYTDEA